MVEGYYKLVVIDTFFMIEDGNFIFDKIKDEVSNWIQDQFFKDITFAKGLLYRNEKIQVLEILQQKVIKIVYEYLLYGYKGVMKIL